MTEQPKSSRTRPERRAWVGLDPSQDDVRPPLSRPRIVRAALQLVDNKGLGALTMRALATELEVSTMAMYNHVRDKEELVDLMLDLVLGEVDCDDGEGDWVAQLRTLVCSFHQALSAHRDLARVYSARVRIGPHGLMIIERALEILLGAGFSPSDATDAFFALYTYTVGYHQVGRTEPLRGAEPGDEGAYYAALPPDRIPHVQAVAPHLTGVHRPGRFEAGLDLLLDGLRTRLELSTRGRPAMGA